MSTRPGLIATLTIAGFLAACAQSRVTPDPTTGKDFAPQETVKSATDTTPAPIATSTAPGPAGSTANKADVKADAPPAVKADGKAEAKADANGDAFVAKGSRPPASVSRMPTEATLDPRGIDYAKAPTRIAFGSDANQDEPQPIWKAIIAADPGLFILAGGAIQLNGNTFPEAYKKLSEIPEYREARQKIPFMATWDDGDFGTPNGGADAATRPQARKEFLAYWPYVKDSILDHDGVYHAKMIGGLVTGKRRKKVTGPTLQVIMLDTRSFRTALKKSDDGNRKFNTSTEKSATLLGESQWEWLEDQLKKPAQFRLVVTPVPLLTTEATDESWALYPQERERFFNLLRKTHVHDLAILSGNRRVGGISKLDVKGWGNLTEVTASPLNHPSDANTKDTAFFGASTNRENFGLVTIDWHAKRVKLELRGTDQKLIQATDLHL